MLILALALLVWLGAVFGAPLWAEEIVEDQLATLPGYDASVEDVDMSLPGGWVAIEQLVVRRPGGVIEEPFLSVERIEARPRLSAWLRGDRIVDLELDGLVIHYVIGETEEKSQTELDAEWVRRQIERFPATLDALVLRESAFHYHDRAARPEVHLVLDQLEARGSNLANLQRRTDPLFGTVQVQGRVMEKGRLEATVHLDPYADVPTFALQASVTDVPLVALDDALRAYGRFDVEAGSFSVTTELVGQDGRFSGVARPEVKDLKVTSLEEMTEEKKPALQIAWEAVVGLAGKAAELASPGRDQIELDVPIRGSFGDEPAVLAVLRVLPNAWFGALTRAVSVSADAGAETAEMAVKAGREARRERGDKPKRDKKSRRGG